MATVIQKLPTRNADAIGPVYETVPIVMPNAVAEDLWTSDVHVIHMHFVNPTGGDITVTINDRQTVAKPVIPAATNVVAGKDLAVNFHSHGKLAKNGLSWIASAAGLVGYIQARQL